MISKERGRKRLIGMIIHIYMHVMWVHIKMTPHRIINVNLDFLKFLIPLWHFGKLKPSFLLAIES